MRITSLRHAIKEIFLGKRGIVQMDTMWLPLSVMLLSDSQDGEMPPVTLSIYLIVSILCWGFVCTYINDITDRKQDMVAAKKRWLACLPPSIGLILVFFHLRCRGSSPYCGRRTALGSFGLWHCGFLRYLLFGEASKIQGARVLGSFYIRIGIRHGVRISAVALSV